MNTSSSSENNQYVRPGIRQSPRRHGSPESSPRKDGSFIENIDENSEDDCSSNGGTELSDKTATPILERSRPSSRSPTAQKNAREDNSNSLYFWSAIIAIGASALCIYLFSQSPKSCNKSMETLMADFPGQDDSLWSILGSVLDEDPRGTQTSSIVLLHSPADLSIARCIASRIATTYACTWFNNPNVTRITPEDVNINVDYGVIIEKYRNGNLSVIVENTTQIDDEKANIFHTLCDDISQFNSPSLYLFLLETKEDLSPKPWKQARDILEQAWSELPHNQLDPLLSRVVGHSLPINPEEKNACHAVEI